MKKYDFNNDKMWKTFLEFNNRHSIFSKKINENKVKNIINDLYNKIIPNDYNDLNIENNYDSCLRSIIIKLQGFALIDKTWTKKLSDFIGNKKCLEIMSGCGSLSKALKDNGINIISTDDFSWDGNSESNWNKYRNYWTDIENIDCIKAIEKYGKYVDYIIMSWAYMDDMAYKSLLKMREINPNCKMIVIGEDKYGCTADDDFFDNINIIDDRKIDEINKLYTSWDGIYDYISLVN